jgi:hypothetical protein
MVLADPPFEIDVTEQRPRPLIPAPHPSPPPNATRQNHITIPVARDFFNGVLGGAETRPRRHKLRWSPGMGASSHAHRDALCGGKGFESAQIDVIS